MNDFLKIIAGVTLSVGIVGLANANTVYSSYTGSQQGFTVRDANTLKQDSFCGTGINANGISVDSSSNVYLAAGNHLVKYSTNCKLLKDMTFPDSTINYTDVAVNGNKVYASYTGSQQGFTIRDANTLDQSSYCGTGINANGISVDSSSNVYLAAGNHLIKYSANCKLLKDMAFPDSTINYTGIATK